MTETALVTMIKAMETKLIELMGEEEYVWFAEQVAKEAFLADVEDCEDEEFKRFVHENQSLIFGEEDERVQ